MKLQKGIGSYFDTVVEITLEDSDPALPQRLLSMCAHYERIFSRTQPGSDIWRINHSNGDWVSVSGDTVRCIEISRRYYDLSDGAFDIRIGSISSHWSFRAGEERIPTEQEFTEGYVSAGQIDIRGDRILVPAGVQLDLGGIAKGYIADRLTETLRAEGVSGAVIDLGGNVSLLGPSRDGGPRRVGIQDPGKDRGAVAAVLSVLDRSVVTSSATERFFVRDGIRYHHLLDPMTGKPADSDLLSATIISPCSAEADALATASFVLGSEKGINLLEKVPGVGAALIRNDGVIITVGDVTLEAGEGWAERSLG